MSRAFQIVALRVELGRRARVERFERFEVDAHRARVARDRRAAFAHLLPERHVRTLEPVAGAEAAAGASAVEPLVLRGALLRAPASRTTVAPGPVPTGMPRAMPRPASRKLSLSRIARCGGLLSQSSTTCVALSSGVPAQ